MQDSFDTTSKWWLHTFLHPVVIKKHLELSSLACGTAPFLKDVSRKPDEAWSSLRARHSKQ